MYAKLLERISQHYADALCQGNIAKARYWRLHHEALWLLVQIRSREKQRGNR